jgi:hypothetical protein
MGADVSRFCAQNVIDTCSIWNLLSARRFYSAARLSNCLFCCTSFVHYECLVKPRKQATSADGELMSRFREASRSREIERFDLDIEDLQEATILNKRKRFGMGEISSIVFAMKTRQAFLTDDQKARALAHDVMDATMVQTTPHLFGWLVFTNVLGDTDKENIINEHESLSRPLRPFFEEVFVEALRCRLMAVPALGPKSQ